VRELTLGRIRHPDPLRLNEWDRDARELIEDPVADRLTKGDPTLGWEGDDRLALYINRTRGTWELVRLERDGQYRITMALPGFVRGHDAVGQMVMQLVGTDVRRGFDPHKAVVERAVAVEREKQRRADDFHDETAERLRHAFRKDGVE
jgi:hypothetical protein